jgi:hypothetical protein
MGSTDRSLRTRLKLPCQVSQRTHLFWALRPRAFLLAVAETCYRLWGHFRTNAPLLEPYPGVPKYRVPIRTPGRRLEDLDQDPHDVRDRNSSRGEVRILELWTQLPRAGLDVRVRRPDMAGADRVPGITSRSVVASTAFAGVTPRPAGRSPEASRFSTARGGAGPVPGILRLRPVHSPWPVAAR